MGNADEDETDLTGFLPAGPVELQFLRRLTQASIVTEILVPRYASWEDIDCDDEDVWDLPLGLVPTTGIRLFFLEANEKLLTFKYDSGTWNLDEVIDIDGVDAQILVHQMKPYVSIRRAVREKEVLEDYDE